MSVSSARQTAELFGAASVLGEKAVSSDFTIQFDGYEKNYAITKTHGWPIVGTAGEIQVPMALGLMMWQKQQIKVNFQSPISFMETRKGHIDDFLTSIARSNEPLQGKIFQGTPSEYTAVKYITGCFIVPDMPETDSEGAGQLMTISGTLFGHYLGEKGAGNI